MMKDMKGILVRTMDVTWRELDGEWILYNVRTDSLHILNHTALVIWTLCNGHHNTAEIIQELAAKFSKGTDEISQSVHRCLNVLAELNLLEEVEVG